MTQRQGWVEQTWVKRDSSWAEAEHAPSCRAETSGKPGQLLQSPPPQCSVLCIEAHPTCRAAGRHHHPPAAAQLRLDGKHARDFIIRAEGQCVLLDLQAVWFGSSALVAQRGFSTTWECRACTSTHIGRARHSSHLSHDRPLTHASMLKQVVKILRRPAQGWQGRRAP